MTNADIDLEHKAIYVAGLPRSGSTLLCQLLGHHEQIYSPQHSSPLAPALTQLRRTLSDSPFLLAQLDPEFELVYKRLLNAYRGFMNGWFAETQRPVVVDKNRSWLGQIETLHVLDPDFKIVVCVRDLGQIYGSVEAQHLKTILLDFPDHMRSESPYQRADKLLGPEGVIGGPLKSIEHLQDIDPALQEHICYVSFESLVSDPMATMSHLVSWLGMPTIKLDPQNLDTKPHESDSYYRFKFRHNTKSEVAAPAPHTVAPRIDAELKKNFRWFYERFYPEQLADAPA